MKNYLVEVLQRVNVSMKLFSLDIAREIEPLGGHFSQIDPLNSPFNGIDFIADLKTTDRR